MTKSEYLSNKYGGNFAELIKNETVLSLLDSATEWYCENKCPYGDECRDEDDCRIGVTSTEIMVEYLNSEHTE